MTLSDENYIYGIEYKSMDRLLLFNRHQAFHYGAVESGYPSPRGAKAFMYLASQRDFAREFRKQETDLILFTDEDICFLETE